MAQIDITKKRRGALATALSSAEPGDELIYHIGGNAGGVHKHDAILAEEARQCLLYQRRMDENKFAYIALKPKCKK